MAKLIINTANDELILSLYYKGKVFSLTNSAKMHHNEVMLPLIDKLLTDNGLQISDVKEFGVVIGPGSFTGIRVGISSVKGFRDGLGAVAKGINNLDFLFKLANSQNKEIETVAIFGSANSYFVARLINGIIYKYPRNLTLEELMAVAKNKPIGMFKQDENVNCFVPKLDFDLLLKCYEESEDYNLVPVYYQLSQAESEKLKRGEVEVCEAGDNDFNAIKEIETSSISTNILTDEDIKQGLTDKNYKTFKITHNAEIVGFIMLQITDEVNIVSIAVKKEFRNTKKITTLDDGTVVEESDDEFNFRRNQRINKINALNEALTKEWVDNIITTLQKVDGNLDPITSRYILQHLPQRVKDVINYKLSESNISAKKQDIISRLKADLSNIDEIMEALNQFDEYKDPFKSFVQSVRNVVD